MTKQKLVNWVSILSMILLVLLPLGVSAETHSDEKNGSLDVQVDRINRDESETANNRETEKEKIFPDLFADETKTMIEQETTEQSQYLEELQDTIFTQNINGSEKIEEVKNTLFSSDYTSEAAVSSTEEESSTSGTGNSMIYILIAIAAALCVGLYLLMQRLLD